MTRKKIHTVIVTEYGNIVDVASFSTRKGIWEFIRAYEFDDEKNILEELKESSFFSDGNGYEIQILENRLDGKKWRLV